APALGADGTIYAAANGVKAFNPADGSVKWFVAGSNSVTSTYFASPVIAHDGSVWSVFWSTSGRNQSLRAFAPADGHGLAQSPDLGTYPISCAPSIASDGTIYLGIHDASGLSGA